MKLDVAADSSMSDLEQQVTEQQNNVKTVSFVAMNSRPSMDFSAFMSTFNEESSITFIDMFFSKYDGDNSKFGCLLAFVASFTVSWKKHQANSKKSKKWLPLLTFLESYASAVAGLSDALKSGDMGKKYKKVTEVEKKVFEADQKRLEATQAENNAKRESFDTDRKKQWCDKAKAVSRDIGAKLTEAKIDETRDFHSALAIIEPVVTEVFNKGETPGFHLVPQSYRQSFSCLLAIMHITAGTDYEAMEN